MNRHLRRPHTTTVTCGDIGEELPMIEIEPIPETVPEPIAVPAPTPAREPVPV